MSTNNFIHIRNYTQFSLSSGALRLNDLTSFCRENNSPAIGISDKGNLFGCMEFSVECIKSGIQPIVSCNLNIIDQNYEIGDVLFSVCNSKGYENLSKLVSLSFLGKNRANKPFVTIEEIKKHKEGLICLSGGDDGLVKKNFLYYGKDKSLEIINILSLNFGNNFYLEIQKNEFNEINKYLDFLINLSFEKKIPLVATNENYYLNKSKFESHDALLSISQQKYIDSENRKKASINSYLKSPKEMIELFSDIPEAISNTINYAKKCSFFLTEKEPKLPKINGIKDEDLSLKNTSIHGLNAIFKKFSYVEKNKGTYTQRLNYELGIISRMGYAGYFLIVADFIKWAKKNNIPVGPGRGSGAGSLVAWTLTITDIDPIRFGLLFERFLNPERVSMPDFDVDFCMEKRDDVIKYVQEKYGKENVAQIITFGSFQARAALRDVGRVLQIPYDQVDKICKLIPFNPSNPASLRDLIETDDKIKEIITNDSNIKKLFQISLELEGLLRHASTHAAGVVISDKPLVNILPLYIDSKSNFPATQFSMKYVEKAGLIKFDFLGLKTLTIISKTIKLLFEREKKIDLSALPLNDKKTFDLLKSGETIGVFQFDGKGMRETIKQIKPDRFEDLIAIVSLYRPGPMDNIPLYVSRKNSNEEIKYIHEDLSQILGETYGIMVYQEQVMEIAQKLAGFSLAKADLLRRAMGKKIASEMIAQKKEFISGCVKNNINEIKAEELFNEVEKFAGYGFNKSHAAAYSLVSYQTAFLKAHYPLEFFCASMECDMNNIEKLNVFCKEVKRLGFKINQPDINKSFQSFTVSYNEGSQSVGINYALGAIKNIGECSIKELVNEREKNGKFSSLIDLLKRVENTILNKRQLENLIYSNSLASIESNQNYLEKNLEKIIKFNVNFHKNKFQDSLFDEQKYEDEHFNSHDFKQWDLITKLKKEQESIGFYLTQHPITYYENFFSNKGFIKLEIIKKLNKDFDERKKNFSSLVVINHINERQSKNGNKYAFLSISDDTDELEVICFSDVLEKIKPLLKQNSFCKINFELTKNNNFIRLSCNGIETIDLNQKFDNYGLVVEMNFSKLDMDSFSLLLNERKGGENVIDFIVKKDNYKLNIKTKERFDIDLGFINTLKKIDGIKAIKRLN